MVNKIAYFSFVSGKRNKLAFNNFNLIEYLNYK